MKVNRRLLAQVFVVVWINTQVAFLVGEDASQLKPLPSGTSQGEPSAPRLKKEVEVLQSGDLSLRFVNADVRTVVQVLAEGADLNLIMSDDLKGNVTVQLRDVSYEDALRLVLESKGFVVVREKNIAKFFS